MDVSGRLLANRYQLRDELGRGGMGTVFLARDTLLERDVAVKVLADSGLSVEGRARWLREARAAAQLSHPNIVAVYDAGEWDQCAFTVMELVRGGSLHEQGAPSLASLVAIACQVCLALAHAHDRGLVHCDLKPENILITPAGTAKLTDFGLLRPVASRVTTEGALASTIYYLAPELAQGQRFDKRSDLYALGVVLYELATGRLPFSGDDPLAILAQHVNAVPEPPRTLRPDLPPRLEALILRLLAKDPDERPSSAEEVRQALENLDEPDVVLHFKFLGGFRISAGPAAITTVNTPRLQALLAYLVLRRGLPQSRQQLAFLLWPDSTDAQARTNLRTLLHRLRAALPKAEAFLRLDAQGVTWPADAPCRLDVDEFEAALAEAERAEHAGDGQAARQALESAVAAYEGDLLPDCYDEWIAPERERLQRLALGALEHLIAQLENQQAWRAALEYAQRLQRLDPLREDAYLILMRLHAAREDRAGVLRVYHACVSTLHDELGVEPGPAIREAYTRWISAEAPAAVPAEALARGAPLVGREPEWARVQATWQAAASGRARLLLLTGEAGLGKTRLAEDLLAWAGRLGAATASAHCYGAEGDLAYAPVTEWLRAEPLRRSLTRLEPQWLAEVARLIPEAVPAPRQPAAPISAAWQRQRLFEALARATVSGERPLLLLLDDLQWCDRDTLEWLHYLLRYQPRARLLVAATLRVEDAGANTALAALLEDLRGSDKITELALRPLSAAETAALAAHLAGQPLSERALIQLYADTEGNPLFVIETVRAGLTSDAAREARDEAAPPDKLRLAPKVQAVLTQRLSQVTPAAHELLRVAAVIGRSFSLGVLGRAAECDETALVQSLDELWQRRIIRERAVEAYDFSHDKLRSVAYAELSAVRRRVLHRRVAQALAAEHAGGLEAVSARIAAHYEQAGLADEAAGYYQTAAAAAARAFANADAIRYLRRALRLLTPAASSERQAQAAELQEQLGGRLHLTGQMDEARAAYQAALGGTLDAERAARTRLLTKIGNLWRDQYQYHRAAEAYDGAEAALRAGPEETDKAVWQAWIQLQQDRFQLHYWLADTAEMLRLMEAVQAAVDLYGSPLQRAHLHQMRFSANFRLDRTGSAQMVAAARAHLSLLEEAGETGMLPSARFQVGMALLLSDELEQAEHELLAALALAERSGDVSLEARCLTYLTVVYRRRRQAEAVRDYAERSLRVATSAQMPDYIGAAEGCLAWLAWLTGDLAQARQRGEQALAAWGRTSLAFAAQWTALFPLLAVALAEDRPAEAAERARALLRPPQNLLPGGLTAALEAAIQQAEVGNQDAAASSLEQACNLAREAGYL